METLDCILKRRSIRRFTDELIPQAVLERILKAGFNAPSAHRLHPLDYIIVTEKERLNGLADLLTYGRPLREAQCAICVVGDHDKQEHFDFLCQDAAASMQNMALMATDAGCASVWIGVSQSYPNIVDVENYLGLPKNIKSLGILALGYPAVDKEANDRYDIHKIHHESWLK